jgi:hypothetical protein
MRAVISSFLSCAISNIFMPLVVHVIRSVRMLTTFPCTLRISRKKHLDYACMTLDDLAGFVLWLKNPYRSLKVLPVQPVTQARTNSTINQCITAVAGFYDYLWRRDELTTDFTEQTRFGRLRQTFWVIRTQADSSEVRVSRKMLGFTSVALGLLRKAQRNLIQPMEQDGSTYPTTVDQNILLAPFDFLEFWEYDREKSILFSPSYEVYSDV